MLAVKGNRQYTITDAMARHYQQDGFDIVEDDGVTIIQHGAGKTILYERYDKVVKELEALKASAPKSNKELLEKIKALTEENAALKAKADEFH